MKPFSKYSLLKSEADASLEITPSEYRPSPPSRAHQVFIYLTIALTSAAITAIIFTSSPRFQLPLPAEDTPVIDLTCGHSVAEALANGCHFDMMASTWEAPPCHDAELLAEVLADGPWQWYRDPEHKELIPREEVALGQFPIDPFYPDSNYHIGHCMYMWKKQHRAYMQGGAISEDLWDYKHTVHCARLVMKKEWPKLGRTQAGFSVCRNEGGWRKHEGLEANGTLKAQGKKGGEEIQI
ncbi:hypothetical protein MMC19_003568 [Ptychographa xylographoides]|nr:hypothetical protein [Ptychographa xylographoides]